MVTHVPAEEYGDERGALLSFWRSSAAGSGGRCSG